MYGPPAVLRQQNQARPGTLKPAWAGGRAHPPPLPTLPEEAPLETPPKHWLATLSGDAGDDISPLSKFKDWRVVKALPPAATGRPRAAPKLQQQEPQRAPEPPQAAAPPPGPAAKAAADVAALVQTLLSQSVCAARGRVAPSGSSATHRPAPTGASTHSTAAAPQAPAPSTAASGDRGGLANALTALADPSVLALATDCVLADLLRGLQPLLVFDGQGGGGRRNWATPGLAELLVPLQHSCLERLRRTTLPCDASLAGAAGRFFARAVREAGPVAVSDDLLAAAVAYTKDSCRLLGGEALAGLMCLLGAARHQPRAPTPVAFGNVVVERLLRLVKTKAGLQLPHLADVVEALAQLRCVDGLSASPVVSLAVTTAQKQEEGRTLVPGQLSQLARIMQSVGIIAATTTVQPGTLLAATAAWHLLVVRAEGLAQSQAATLLGECGAPHVASTHMGLALSRMWCASRVLLAASKASNTPSFVLPDRLGLASHAAYLDHEQRSSSTGLTSAQRRVLAALSALKVVSSKVSVNADFLEVFQISVAVRMRLQSSGQVQRTAILIHEPLRHLLRNPSPGSVMVGGRQAQERLLQAAGWQVVCLDAQCCLSLPVPTLAEELAALLIGDKAASSLRFAA